MSNIPIHAVSPIIPRTLMAWVMGPGAGGRGGRAGCSRVWPGGGPRAGRGRVLRYGAVGDPTFPPEADAFRKKGRAFLGEHLPPGWQGVGALPTREEAEQFIDDWRA